MFLDKFFKWLRPGLRIKRWIAVILLGIVFAVISTGMFILFWWATPGYGRLPGKELLLFSALGYALAGFCLITGIYRLIKSMWGLVDRRGARKGLVEAAYE